MLQRSLLSLVKQQKAVSVVPRCTARLVLTTAATLWLLLFRVVDSYHVPARNLIPGSIVAQSKLSCRTGTGNRPTIFFFVETAMLGP